MKIRLERFALVGTIKIRSNLLFCLFYLFTKEKYYPMNISFVNKIEKNSVDLQFSHKI